MRIRIQGDSVISGDGSVYDDGAVLIENDRIVDVGLDEEVSKSDVDQEYSLAGHTVMPGLIDVHTHIGSVGDPDRMGYTLKNSPSQRVIDTIENARKTVEAGITTIRDVGTPNDIAMTVRDAIADGLFPGPRIFACGEGLTSTGGHGDELAWHLADSYDDGRKGRLVSGVADAKLAVREQLQRGADGIKVWATGGVIDPEGEIDSVEFSQAELDAIVEEADRHNVHVCSHAHPPSGIKASVEAGVRSIEHGMFINEESARLMAENDVYLVSTLSVMKKLTNNPNVPEYYRTNTREAIDHHTEMLPIVDDLGVRFAMGTDAGAPTYPHGENAMELECLVDAGLDPLRAIEISTRQSAELLEIDDLGILDEGYKADIIAVEGDPIDDISLITDPENVVLVIADGSVVKE